MTNDSASDAIDMGVVPSMPVSNVPLQAKARLLSGRNFWETESLPEVGIRSLVLSDGPYGLRHQSGRSDNLALFESDPATCFLPGVAVGSSWDTSVAARVGAALGKEAVAQGVDIVLGPGINIKRTPLCGRNFEYYSEDPHLSGVLGVAFTRALQAEGPGVSVKHFAANNQETDRQTISADVDERALREIYFPAFERVVTEARPATVMSSYNKINGVPASEDPWLLTKVLREEWGFEGVVVSDWSAVNDRVAALKAGLDLEMPGGDAERDEEVAAAIASGRITESEIDVSVDRLRALSDRIRRTPVSVGVDLDAHHLLARELAQECVVLLRNQDDTLPIGDGITMAVIGAIAETPRYQGGGSAHVTATRVDLPLEQIRDVAAECAVVVSYAPGYRIDGTHDEELIVEAVSTASQAELAVVFAGLSETRESEGFDRRNLELPPEQVELIRRVAAASQRTVVVLSNGGVVSSRGGTTMSTRSWKASSLAREGASPGEHSVRTGKPFGTPGGEHPVASAGSPELDELPRGARTCPLRRRNPRRVPVLRDGRGPRALPVRAWTVLYDVRDGDRGCAAHRSGHRHCPGGRDQHW